MIKDFLLEKLIVITHKTYRLKVSNWEKARKKTDAGGIFLGWHCFIWIYSHLFPHIIPDGEEKFVTLASLSSDGELIARILNRLDWAPVRGSSSRGAVRSLRILLDKLDDGRRVVITPDGPRGPARKMKPGAILLQRRSELPIIPTGTFVKWKYRFSSWDRFQFPLPGSKLFVHFGDPIYNLEEKNREEACNFLEEAMINAEKRAREKAM